MGLIPYMGHPDLRPNLHYPLRVYILVKRKTQWYVTPKYSLRTYDNRSATPPSDRVYLCGK